MRSLKRVLALTLALVTMLTAMASAAYTDGKDIDTKEAVDMLSTLGVINGYTDGSFRPETKITKAELAKMIYVIKNGGKDDKATQYKNIPCDLTDVKGHWAEGYIKYGYVQGIIAGNGKGKFDPEKTVTGFEAAKMLLTITGYDATKAGLVGTSWETNTLALGADRNLFENYELGFDLGSTREYASQMVYNSLFAGMVKYEDGQYNDVYSGDSVLTIGEKHMGLETTEGTLLATGEYSLGTVAGAGKDRLVIEKHDGTTLSLEFKGDASALVGRNVRVVANSKKDTIYGVYGGTDNTELTLSLGDIKLENGKLYGNDKEIKFEAAAKAYVGEVGTDFTTAFATQKDGGESITFVSNNGDNKMDLAIVENVKVGTVTGVYKDRITTDITGFTSISTKEDSKNDIFKGVAKDDVVAVRVNSYDDGLSVKEMDQVSGKVEATKTGAARIGDTWYKLAAGAVSGTALPTLGDEVKLSTLGSYIYATEKVSESAKDMAVVTAVSSVTDIDGNYDAKLTFADGTAKVVKIKGTVAVGTLVTYSIKNSVYTVNAISDTNKAGYEKFISGTAGFVEKTDKLDGNLIADDAVIFIQYVKNGEKLCKTITGADLKKMNADFGDSYTALVSKTSGFDYIKAANIITSQDVPSLSGDESFGYLLEVPHQIKIDDTSYVVYTIFTGKDTIEVRAEGSTVVATQGELVQFDRVSDKVISAEAKVTLTLGAVAAYDKTGGEIMMSGDTKTYKITKDTKIVYVDSDTFEGFEDGNIKLADKTDTATYVNNVKFAAKSTAENGTYALEYLVVDVNNEIK